MKSFDIFDSRTVISAVLRMETALSVGSRSSLEPTGTDMPVIKRPDGLPFIPGSSIKGVVRAEAERVLRAINRRPDLWACDIFESSCVTSEEKDSILNNVREKEEAEKLFTQQLWDKSCAVCRLFGSQWIASRLAFKDAFLCNQDSLLVVTQIRDGVGIDRDTGAAKEGIKYDFETVSPGAEFSIEILAENVDIWEIGFLLTILRSWQEGRLAVGGKSTRGPGWGTLNITSIRRVDKENLLEYLMSGEMKEVAVESALTAFKARFS